MTAYLIYFNQQWVGDHTPEWFMSRAAPSMAVIREMQAAGVYVFAGGLEEHGPVVSVDATSGSVVTTEGPYAETTEVLGGFTVIDVPDLQTATAWAAKVAVGCGWPQEVRQFGAHPDVP